MIAELCRYLTTPCPWHLRRLGYLKEAIGLEARGRRCGLAWEAHLRACQGVIRDAASAAMRHRRAVILGSGGLHDVPYAALAGIFDEVLLVDLIHLPRIRRLVRPLRNVRIVGLDVTGILAGLERLAPGAPLPPPDARAFDGLLEADLVVSANLLFQLPVLPKAFLAARGGWSDEEIDGLCRGLVEAHLAALRSAPGQVALITEVEHLLRDRGGRIVERDPPLPGVALPAAGREWFWEIAPRPEADRDHDLVYRVKGFIGMNG